MELREYLDTLVSQIRCKKARGMVEEEVAAHITDQMEACETAGMTKEEAEKEAVRQMGDPVEAGVALDRIHRPRMDWKILLLVGVLSLLGLAVQYVIGEARDGEPLVWYQAYYTGAGILLMLVICWVDYSIIGRFPVWLWLGFSAVILGYSLFGPIVNGNNNYLRPVIYLYVPLYAGILYRYRGGAYPALLTCAGFVFLSMCISMRAVTMPVCLDVAVICLLMTVLALWKNWFRVPKKRTVAILLGAVFTVPAAIFICGINGEFTSYQMDRIRMMMSDSPMYQQAHLVRRIWQEGALAGQRTMVLDGQNYLASELIPGSAYSEYILTYIISYYGILAGIAVLLLFAVFLIRIFRISAGQKNQLGQMVGMGCSMIFAVQLYHYIMFNLGIGVLVGINLPFFTFGKWVALSTYILAGLLLSIYRYKDVSTDRKPDCRKSYRIRIEKVK